MTSNEISIAAGFVCLWVIREIGGFVLKTKLEKYKDSVHKVFNKKLFAAVFDLIALAYFVWFSFLLFDNGATATKRDVLYGIGMSIIIVTLIINFLDDFLIWIRRYKEIGHQQTTGLLEIPVVLSPEIPIDKLTNYKQSP